MVFEIIDASIIEWPDEEPTDPPVRSKDMPRVGQVQHVRKSADWGLVKSSLWWTAWLVAAPWALVFGFTGVVLCCTIVGIPFGVLLMTVAGLPGAGLIGLRYDTKEVRNNVVRL